MARNHLMILREYKERLEYSLEDADHVKFSLKLVQSKIISKDVKDNFDCLDRAHLEADIKVRYLLQQVCERVREDDKVYDRLVRKVLSTLGGSVKDVCEAMRKELDRVEGGKASGGAEGGVCLTEKDVPYLVKLLVSGSHRWELIGIALGVPEYVRDECRDRRDNPSKLSHILTAWISGSYDGARPATVGVLREALSSEVVEFRKLVQYLSEFNTPVETSTETRLQLLESLPQIECQSYDTEVAEGKSTLLEVQVSSSGCESYQWSKNGQPLLDGADFSGVSSNILYIDRASQSTEGKYSCCVSTGSETVCSDEINLMVIKLSIEEVDLVKLLDCLLNSEVISRCIYNKFTSLDQIHLEPDIKVRYLLQQVCERVREDDKVYDRLVRVPSKLHGILRDLCDIMRKRVDRDREGKDIYVGTTYCSLLELEISINPVPTTNRACSNIDPEMYTKVAECKSTLLEVQVSSNGCESYKWSKNDQLLLDGADFSGVSSNILYINRASQGTEGKYSCCVSNGSETVCSDEINLMVTYPPEKKRLIKLYSLMESDVPRDSWPPVGNSTFINLVLIKQSHISRRDYYTVHGDVDDILVSKEVVEYEEVFREYREGAVVLVEGRPGSGKTTLVHKVTRDWATGRKVLQGARMVFLITLRLLNYSGSDKSLLDVLEVFFGGEVLRKKIEHDLQECGGKGACFIIDGLDEYQPKSVEESVIYQLIDKKCLPFSMVIVASRPVATNELKKDSSKCLEVIGFNRNQIFDYLETYPFVKSDIPDASTKLKVYLKIHPNVLHMCYLPVHAAMICFLFVQLEGNIPNTETKIYEQFTISTLLRQKTHNKYQEQQQLTSLKDLCGDKKIDFSSICNVAFDMTVKSQQVVSRRNAPEQFFDFSSSVFGLLTVERTCRIYGIEDLYTFHHLTFQEYLAALYIAEQKDDKQQHIITKYCKESSCRNMWKFYCGVIELKKNAIQNLLRDDFLYNVRCAFESQQVEVCDYVVNPNTLVFKDEIITPSDFAALGYVLSTSSKTLSVIKLEKCKWDRDAASAFSVISKKPKSLNCLKYLEDSCSHEDFKALNGFLNQLPFLEELDLLGVKLDKSCVEYLTSNITLSQLKVLKISLPLVSCSHPEEVLKLLRFGSCNIKQIQFCMHSYGRSKHNNYAMWRKWLCYAFGFLVFLESDISWLHLYNSDEFSSLPQERFSYCSEVVLVNCGIDDEGADILAIRLNTSVLENLLLDFNRISDSGAVALAGCIARCSVVQEVSIQCNSIGDSGAIALADALVHCSSLRRLDLQGNALGDEGAVAIATAVEGSPNFSLYLNNMNITEEGIERVLEHRASTKIRAMVFGSSWNAICDAGIDTLRSALKCGTIPALRISKTNISNFAVLVTELEHVRNIQGLLCSVSDNTVPILCDIIKSMSHLKHLEIKGIRAINSTSQQLLSDSLKTCMYLHSVAIRSRRNYGQTLYSFIWDFVQHCGSVLLLAISKCMIDSVQMTSLFNDHKSWVNLHTLTLRSNNIGPDGAQVLKQVLLHCRSLRCLDLFHTGIGDSGAVALAEGLQDHTSLLKLRLGNSGITLDGITSLIHVIRCNHLLNFNISDCSIGSGVATLVDVMCADTLQVLELGKNGLNLDGTASLSVGLKSCRQLVNLGISHNNIGPHGMSSLAEGLQYCTNLQALDLSYNKITSDGVGAIVNVMKHCRYLRKLDLRFNSINVDDTAVLISGWQHRNTITIDLEGCFGNHLLETNRCCSSCDQLLNLYFYNDYVVITLGIIRSIPKLQIFFSF